MYYEWLNQYLSRVDFVCLWKTYETLTFLVQSEHRILKQNKAKQYQRSCVTAQNTQMASSQAYKLYSFALITLYYI
jgi:hypothetical protein